MVNIKRKIRRFLIDHQILVCTFCVVLVLSLMTTGYSLLKTDLKVLGQAKIATDGDSSEKDPEDMTEVCQTEITTRVGSSWSGFYIVYVEITNNAIAEIYNWGLKLVDSEGISDISTSMADAKKFYEKYYLSSLTWNSIISPGNSVEIQMTLATDRTDIENILDNIVVTSCGRGDTGDGDSTVISSGNASLTLGQLERQLDAQIELTEAGAWGGAVNIYKLTITNNLTTAINGWRGMVHYGDKTIRQIYPGETIHDEAAHNVIISNTNKGGFVMQPGESTELTLVLNTDDPNYIPDIIFAGVIQL